MKGQKVVCGRSKRNGDPCLQEAGAGTDHPGHGACRWHGGTSPSGEAEARGIELVHVSRPVAVDPGQAVQGALHAAAGELAYATLRVSQLREDQLVQMGAFGPYRHAWWDIKVKAEERIVKFAKVAADMGIDAAKLEIARAQTAMMGSFIEAVARRLKLTDEQRRELGPAIREELAVIAGKASPIS